MKRGIAFSAISLLFTAGVALAQSYGGFGASGGGSTAGNLTILDQSSGCNGNNVLIAAVTSNGARTNAGTTLTPGEKTLIHMDVGDSLSTNTSVDNIAYVPTNTTKNQNFNPYTATNLQFVDPLTGTTAPGVPNTGGSWQAIVNDNVINAGKWARSIAISIGWGGSCSKDWAPSGNMFQRARIGCMMARIFGWPISGTGDGGNWKFYIHYALGTNDNAQGVSASAFTANAIAFSSAIKAYGCTGDIFVAKQTMLSGVVNVAIQAAQVALVDNVNFWAGYDRDSITSAGLTDGTHMYFAGNSALATDLANKFVAH